MTDEVADPIEAKEALNAGDRGGSIELSDDAMVATDDPVVTTDESAEKDDTIEGA